MHLDISELFIAFILENLSKESNIVVFSQICLDAVDNSRHPLDDQTLESVSLIQVCVHELLHGFSGKVGVFAFLVVLHFLRVDVVDDVLELLESQDSGLGLAHWALVLLVFAVLGSFEDCFG